MSRVVVALGGNALLPRGLAMTIEHQRAAVAVACEHLAPVATVHELVVAHGNGPQIGLLALEAAAYESTAHGVVPAYPLDVLGAETQGMVGYLVQVEMGNRLAAGRSLVTVLTMVEVDADDPAFGAPTKPIGPRVAATEAARWEAERGWTFGPDGDGLRRLVPSPAPRRIIEVDQIAALVDGGSVVICAGGGGIPVVADGPGRLRGVEAVVDKDLASARLACDLRADALVLATDVQAVFLGFGTRSSRAVTLAHPDALLARHRAEFGAGSMLPKVVAACDFARTTGRPAVIGGLADIEAMVGGTGGTRISTGASGVQTLPV
jgi:carbamate kinase